MCIYLDGTSINTITNTSGKFELKTKSVINTKLVIHHLSYETAIIDHPFEGMPDTLYIKEQIKTIREVTVRADRFTREQKMKAFREQFLGLTRAGKSCTIENEEDIRLKVDMQNELALEGRMFVNMIALKWYYVILNLLKKHELNKKYSPADFLLFLSEVKMVKISNTWQRAEVTRKTLDLMQKLGLEPIT